MSVKYHLSIDNASIDGTTGHHTVQVHIEETGEDDQVRHGIAETYGIDSTALHLAYGGIETEWLKVVATDMLAKHKRRTDIQQRLLSMAGQKIEISL